MVDTLPLVMTVAGFIVGLVGVLFGGSMFLAVPVFQFMFPGAASFGAIVGSIKVGSLSRGALSTLSTWHSINLRAMLSYWPVLLGSVLGAIAISQVTQDMVIPVLVLAILVAANPKRLSRYIQRTRRLKPVLAFLVGVYAGLFGAGISVLLLALVRVGEAPTYDQDSQIMSLNIQVRFLEFLAISLAVAGHIYSGVVSISNWPMWLWWGIGAGIAGFVGGHLLVRAQAFPVLWQKLFLFGAFAIALVTSAALYLPG